MTYAIVLSAGKATRMGSHAPDGVKAHADIGGGATILSNAKKQLKDMVAVVCACPPFSSAGIKFGHINLPAHRTVADAVRLALQMTAGISDNALIVYGDTYWSETIPDEEFIGVSGCPNMDRPWDCVDQKTGMMQYRLPKIGEPVHIGMFRIDDTQKFIHCLEAPTVAQALNTYFLKLPLYRVESWYDCGDEVSLFRLRKYLEGCNDTRTAHPSSTT